MVYFEKESRQNFYFFKYDFDLETFISKVEFDINKRRFIVVEPLKEGDLFITQGILYQVINDEPRYLIHTSGIFQDNAQEVLTKIYKIIQREKELRDLIKASKEGLDL